MPPTICADGAKANFKAILDGIFFALTRILERIAATRRPSGNAPLPSMGIGAFLCVSLWPRARKPVRSPRPKVGELAHRTQGVGIFAQSANEAPPFQIEFKQKKYLFFP